LDAIVRDANGVCKDYQLRLDVRISGIQGGIGQHVDERHTCIAVALIDGGRNILVDPAFVVEAKSASGLMPFALVQCAGMT